MASTTARRSASSTKHPYQVGDVIIWDNCSLLHSAPLIEADRPRTLWRITVKEAGPTL